MKQVKLIQLSANATSLETKAKCYKASIDSFHEKFVAFRAALPAKLQTIREALHTLNVNATPLSKEQLEQLHGLQRIIAQYQSSLQKEFQKPMLEFQKDLDKCITSINKEKGKCSVALNTTQDKDESKSLQDILTKLQECLDVNIQAMQVLASCATHNNFVSELLLKMESEIQRLDLPHELQNTIKQVERLTDSLSQMQLQLSTAPQRCIENGRDLLLLCSSLEALRIKSQSLSVDTNTLLASVAQAQVAAPAPGV
jgi:hypothetical protein